MEKKSVIYECKCVNNSEDAPQFEFSKNAIELKAANAATEQFDAESVDNTFFPIWKEDVLSFKSRLFVSVLKIRLNGESTPIVVQQQADAGEMKGSK